MKARFSPSCVAACLAVCIVAGTSVSAVRAAGAPTPASAAVKGVVKFAGTPPKPMHIDMSADPKCAQAHAGGGMAEDVVTDGKGGLENVVVYVSSTLGDAKFDPPKEPATIEQKGCMYTPHVVAM